MITEGNEQLDRPAEEVFAFIADVRNDPRWHGDVLEARLTNGEPVGNGSIFEIRTKPFMGVSGGTVTVSEYDPPHRIVFDVEMGKMRPTTTFTVTPEDGGSRVTRCIDMEPNGVMRLMAPFMAGIAGRRNAGFLAELKRVLESENRQTESGG